MSSVTKRPFSKSHSTAEKFNEPSAIDKSDFLQSIREDSHLFQGLGDGGVPTVHSKIETTKHNHASISHLPKENPQFMHLYDENTKLKQAQARLETTVKELRQHNKDAHRPGLNKQEAEELNGLRRENKNLSRTVFQMKTNQRGHSQKKAVSTLEKQKITDLLKVIDKYKSQALSAEEQLKRYQENDRSHIGTALGKKDAALAKSSYNLNDYSIAKEGSYLHQSPSMSLEVNRLKEQNTFLQAEISRLTTQITTKNMMQDEIYDLKLENKKLEDTIRRMTESPLFGGMTDKIQDETKMKDLEEKLKSYNQRLEKERERVIRLETELKMTQTKLVEASLDSQNHESENIKLRSKVKEHPLLDVIVEDEEMLHKVIGFLQTENYRSDVVGKLDKANPRYSRNDPNLKIETLISENELLALELTRNQKMLKTLKDLYQQHEKVRQLEQRQFSQLLEERDKKVNEMSVLAGQKSKIEVMKNGVKYEDEVSVFSHDDNSIFEVGTNFFDLYLAEINLVDTFIRQQLKLSDVSRIMNFATVDFYNHQTQNTKVNTGLHYNMNSQFSFKVGEDECLFKYLERGEVAVTLWTTDGAKTINLGEAKISLKPMILNSKPSLAPVVNSSVPLYLHNKTIGTLNFVMRMRLPIYKQLSQIKSSFVDTQSLGLANYESRKLVVKIEAAEGLPMSVTSFVYYTINGNDHYTQPYGGSNPLYDHMNVIPITYSPDFEQYLRQGELEFTVIDDNAPMNDAAHTDVVGTSKIPLSKLLFVGGNINESLKVVNNKGEIKGNLFIKVFWYQTEEDAITSSIANTMANNMAGMFNGSFGEFNQNTGFSSQSDFVAKNIATFGNIASLINQGSGIKNPSTIGGGGSVVNVQQGMYQSGKKPVSPAEINNMIKQQSQKRGINPNDVYTKFDQNNTGIISKGELKEGLIAGFGLRLEEKDLQAYFDSFEQPITMDNFYKSFGLPSQSMHSSVASRKEVPAPNRAMSKAASITSNTSSVKPVNPQEVSDYIRQYAGSNNFSVEDLYLKFDDNKTGVISKDELKHGLLKTFGIKLTDPQLENYFRTFSQPLTLESFRKGLTGNQSLSAINRFIQSNTSQLKKQPLKEFLKNKDLFSISLQIDRDNNGLITKKQLQQYLESKGVETTDVVEEKITVMQFLKKHSTPAPERESSGFNIPRTVSMIVSDSEVPLFKKTEMRQLSRK